MLNCRQMQLAAQVKLLLICLKAIKFQKIALSALIQIICILVPHKRAKNTVQ